MSVSISNLFTRSKTLTVRIGGEVIHLTYNPGVITRQFLADDRPMTETLPEVIKEWDIVDDGKPLPVTQEGMQKLPFDVINLLWKKIVRDVTDPYEEDEKKD